MSARRKATLDRRAVVAAILRQRDNALVVAGLGAPCFDVMACGDNPLNFYTWGAMGGTAMIGLGLALAQPKRREILRLLADRELTAGEIASHFAVTQPAISQHLKILKDVELLNERRVRLTTRYSWQTYLDAHVALYDSLSSG